MIRRRRSLLLALSTLCFLGSGCISAPSADPALVVRGPLPTRVQHPFALTILSMRPRRAAIQPAGTWDVSADLAYSSIHEVNDAPGEAAYFDGETARTGVRLRRGLGGGWDLETELSVLFGTGGFLDSFIEGFHEFFGFPDGGRPLVERDQYLMSLRYHGQTLYDLVPDDPGFGDLPLVFTRQLRQEDDEGPGVALRLGVELPTGSAERGFGNGAVDFGAGAILESTQGRWTITGGLDVIQPGDPDPFTHAGLALNTLYILQSGLEYRWSDRLSLLTQLVYTSPFTRVFKLEEFSSEMLDLGLGFAWERGGARFHVAFLEELVAKQGPDIGVKMGAAWGF